MHLLARRLPRLLPLAALLALAPCLPAPAAAQEPAPAPAELKEVPLAAEQRAAFVGRYTLTSPDGEPMEFQIWEENGALLARPNDEEPARLIHLGDNVFTADGHTEFRLTFQLEAGKAKSFSVKRNDEDLGTATRMPEG
jgi:hypothetical protein